MPTALRSTGYRMTDGMSAFSEPRSGIRVATEQLLKLLIPTRFSRDVRYSTVSSYSELLRATEPSIFWTDAPQKLPPNDELLFPCEADELIRSVHSADSCAPTGIGFASFNYAIVSGKSLVGTPHATYRLGPVVPGYVDAALSNAERPNSALAGRRKISRRSRWFIPGCSVVVTHWNAGVYGHWLLECMPKLLLIRRELDRLPSLRIIVPASMPRYVSAWISRILPGIDVEILDQDREYLCCERLLMPTLLMDTGNYFHPALLPMLDDLLGPSMPSSPDRRLYVSRVTPSAFRALINREEIEAIAAAEGLTVVKPETLSIQEQMKLFAGAGIVIGEFGSAMHNTVFSPAGTRVLCLNWINELQSRIARLKRQSVGYLLPSNGKAVRFIPFAPQATYHIDPQTFRSRVRALLG